MEDVECVYAGTACITILAGVLMGDVLMTEGPKKPHMIKPIQTNQQEPDGAIGRKTRHTGAVGEGITQHTIVSSLLNIKG